jgi:hypothetical protein
MDDALILQVLIPNIVYVGHQPVSPVATGIIPNRNQRLCGPQKAKLVKKSPKKILKTRS